MPRITFKTIELPSFMSREIAVTAWAAGVLDAEGSVICSPSGGSQCKVPHIHSQVVIGQAQKGLPLLKALAQLFGGSVSRNVKPVHTWSAYYVWGLYGKNTVPFLKRIEPYLILKRQQARCVIDLEEYRARDGNINKPRSQEFMRYAWRIVDKMHALNWIGTTKRSKSKSRSNPKGGGRPLGIKNGQGKWSDDPRPMTTGRCIKRAFVSKMMEAGRRAEALR